MITLYQAGTKMQFLYELAEIPVVFTNFFPWHFVSSSTFDCFWSFDMFDTLWRIQCFRLKTMHLLRLLTLLIQPIETFEAICNNIRLQLKQTQKVEVKISNWSNQKSSSRNLQKIKFVIIANQSKMYILSYSINTVKSFLLNACNIPVFEQMTPAPSCEPQSSTVRWGQSRRDVSLPVHCTLSIPKVLETDPNWDCEVCCP